MDFVCPKAFTPFLKQKTPTLKPLCSTQNFGKKLFIRRPPPPTNFNWDFRRGKVFWFKWGLGGLFKPPGFLNSRREGRKKEKA